jgi:Ribonuclease G/E
VGGRINPQRLRSHELAELSKRVVFDVADVLTSRFLVDGDDATAVLAAAGAHPRSVILVEREVPEQDRSCTESRLTNEQVLRVPAEHRCKVRVPIAARAFGEVDVFVRMRGQDFGRSVHVTGVAVKAGAGDVLPGDIVQDVSRIPNELNCAFVDYNTTAKYGYLPISRHLKVFSLRLTIMVMKNGFVQ